MDNNIYVIGGDTERDGNTDKIIHYRDGIGSEWNIRCQEKLSHSNSAHGLYLHLR